MKKFIFYLVVGLIVIMAFSSGNAKCAEVKGKVVDKLSGDAVWGVRITVDGKCTTHYLSKTYHLTGVEPGAYTLVATAPNYYEFKKNIQVKKGTNIVDIFMRGKEIPDLQEVKILTKSIDKGIQLEIWFINSKGDLIKHYPCLPLTLEVKLFLDIGKEKIKKGKKIYEGQVDLFWDADTSSIGKNKAIIPWSKINVDKEIEEREGVIIVKRDEGILEAVLHTPQGDFKCTSVGVRLFQYPKDSSK